MRIEHTDFVTTGLILGLSTRGLLRQYVDVLVSLKRRRTAKVPHFPVVNLTR